MTELNHPNSPQPAQQTPEWPATGTDIISDPVVAGIMAGLDSIQGMPVTDHEAVYAELHDALLEALNDDAPGREGRA